jgi:hypothetical protein
VAYRESTGRIRKGPVCLTIDSGEKLTCYRPLLRGVRNDFGLS